MVKVRRSDSQAQFRGRLKILQRGFQTAFVYLGRTTAEPPASFVGLFHVLLSIRLPIAVIPKQSEIQNRTHKNLSGETALLTPCSEFRLHRNDG